MARKFKKMPDRSTTNGQAIRDIIVDQAILGLLASFQPAVLPALQLEGTVVPPQVELAFVVDVAAVTLRNSAEPLAVYPALQERPSVEVSLHLEVQLVATMHLEALRIAALECQTIDLHQLQCC